MNDMNPPEGPGMTPSTPATPPDAPPTEPPAAPPPRNRVLYDGRVGDLGRIAVSNGLLGLLTLGIYRFWGKTRLRDYLWGRVDFLGDRFEYSGTAKELLIGFLVALAILAPLIGGSVAVDLAYEDNLEMVAIKNMVQGVVILFLIQLAIYRARRYRLTRTQWRGIRGGQTGSSFKYGFMTFGWMFVVLLTLGLAYPVYRTRLQRYRTENTWFGDRRCEFHGAAADLFGSWVLAWLFYLPSFGLTYVWYRVKELRYFISKTRYGALSFESDLSGVAVFLVYLFYSLALFMVFALLGAMAAGLVPALSGAYQDLASGDPDAIMANAPMVNLILIAVIALVVVVLGVLRILLYLHPMFRIVCRSLGVTGEEDYAAIAQSRQSVPGRGEGFADALDVGAF
jgi:uncharacterized membrane protein YjgN (DUF898 family)